MTHILSIDPNFLGLGHPSGWLVRFVGFPGVKMIFCSPYGGSRFLDIQFISIDITCINALLLFQVWIFECHNHRKIGDVFCGKINSVHLTVALTHTHQRLTHSDGVVEDKHGTLCHCLFPQGINYPQHMYVYVLYRYVYNVYNIYTYIYIS